MITCPLSWTESIYPACFKRSFFDSYGIGANVLNAVIVATLPAACSSDKPLQGTNLKWTQMYRSRSIASGVVKISINSLGSTCDIGLVPLVKSLKFLIDCQIL